MKGAFLLSLVGSLAMVAGSLVCAQHEESQGCEAGAVACDVPTALRGLRSFNGTPSADARFYIYLQSASWCFPCVREMPGIVAAYDEMKANGVELVLIGCDETVEAAQKFLESFQATFPGVHYKDERINTLPGYLPAKGVPDAIFVDRQGRVLRRGHGYLVQFWRQVLGFEPQSDASAAAPKAP